jgi:hypothetical protein
MMQWMGLHGVEELVRVYLQVIGDYHFGSSAANGVKTQLV